MTRRIVTLAAGHGWRYRPEDWIGALVVVAAGGIVLEGVSGRRQPFAAGAVLGLASLPLRAIRNGGPDPAVLLVLTP
jgi:hypothetical protein